MGALLTYIDSGDNSYALLTTAIIDENENFKKLYNKVSFQNLILRPFTRVALLSCNRSAMCCIVLSIVWLCGT